MPGRIQVEPGRDYSERVLGKRQVSGSREAFGSREAMEHVSGHSLAFRRRGKD